MAIGNLTNDPTVRQVSSENDVTIMNVAINNPLNKEDVLFIDVEAWNKVGEYCAKYLTKGKRVFVEGRVKSSSWTTKEGNKAYKTFIVASSVQFLSPVSEAASEAAVEEAKVTHTSDEPSQVKEEELDEVPI